MFRFDCAVLSGTHVLVGARWKEGLSQRFRVEVFVAVAAADAFDPEEALWLDGAFHIDGPRGDVPFFGVVGECEEVFSVAAGQGDSEFVTKGLDYIASTWTDGGALYNTAPDTAPDANSTALAIQALIATGADVTSQQAALASFQNASGAFFYNSAETADNLFATLQAIPAMASATLPATATPIA